MQNGYIIDSISDDILCMFKKNSGFQNNPYHRHNGYELYLFLGGNIFFNAEDKSYKLKRGDMVLVSPSTTHNMRSSDDGTSYYERVILNVKQSVFERLSTPLTDLSSCFHEHNVEPIRLSEEEVKQFCELAQRIIDVKESKDFGADVEIDAYMTLLLLMINRLCKTEQTPRKNVMPQIVKDVMRYIGDNLTEDVSLAKLSEITHYNSTYISSLFKKHTGLTLREYITDLKIEEAKRLLLIGESVSDACCKSGFSDYSNFIRAFSKATGLSPGKYAKSIKNNIQSGST